MSKILILGAGIAGHTAAAHLRRKLSGEHEVLVVSPNRNYQWVPSNISRMQNPFIQFFKLIYLSLKILGIVAGGHGGTRK